MNNDIKSGNFVFKPRARIIKTIGEELISNDNVAVVELVKNSYDANSQIVEITFVGNVKERQEGKKIRKYLNRENASIIIYDSGSGMDFDIIQSAWMEPATNFKKKNQNVSPNRKFTGEKGIGRFASAKLASKLELITKQKDSDEIVVHFNWDDFSNEDNYLENINVHWEIRQPTEIKDSGTILKLIDLNNDWDEDKIRELRVTLSRLLNPIVPTEDFLISVNIPDGLDKSLDGTIERPETLNKPDYYIKGTLTDKGRPDNFLFFSKIKGQEESLTFTEKDFLLKEPQREPVAGKFSFEFRIWNRDDLSKLSKEVNSTVKNVKKDLDDLSGISIYRDNVRVLPYGNKNNDWARLDIRRVNNPTLRLSNNQIVGYIAIGLDTNPLLKDQSNREGIVEGQALEDVKDFIKLILNEVEQRRYKERPRESEKQSVSKESLFEKFSLQSISTLVKEKAPAQKEILEAVEKKDVEIKESISKVQEVISRYRRLTTLGQLIDAVVHDGGNYLNTIDLQANLIIKALKKPDIDKEEIQKLIANIQSTRKDFAQLFRRIEPFGGRKRGRPKTVIVKEVIKNQFLLCHTELSRLNISYEISETQHTVTIDEAELGIIFMNLIQNSVYWLENIDTERKIAVEVSKSNEELSIIFSDSGPGIKTGTEENIFEPYFSTKPDGIGLGLAIVGELVSEYNGELMLINNGILDGATFKITFRYRI
ncbi:MAG: ATP-binding protein [Holosporales bacterium]|jgi:signal transduction histidine kinase|nr:ATP-binding protein [Holosporales bacterium]